jgi:outer membrane cobalamin receptor
MKHFILFILSLVIIESSAQSRQKPGFEPPKLSGIILNENNETIPFANIAIYKSADSTLLKGDASDLEGNFSIPIRPGNYYLSISFLSAETKILPNVSVTKSGKRLGKIYLKSSSTILGEVEIVAEKSQMELKLDKRIFNVSKDLSNAGSNAAEILDNIPSVTVDVEGNISLRGSENVRVLVDGKPSTMTGGSTADILRQFQGSMIERVEVITNPSARYDADGEVGIINIVLKKEKQKGVNGSIEAVAGYPDNYRLSFNLNFRQEKFNLFTSYGAGYRSSPGGGETYQSFLSPDTSYIYESENDRTRSSLNHNIRLGTDYFINDKNTITIAGFFRESDQENTAEYDYKDLFANGELFQFIERNDIEDETGKSLQASINYRKTFKKKDKLFTIDIQGSESNDLEKSNIEQKNYLLNTNLFQKSRNVEANKNYLFQSDFALPIGREGLFETGIRVNYRLVENNFKVEQQDTLGNFEILPEYNNDFIYDEKIYAAYMMYGNKIKKFSYQIGLRAEQSEISTDLKVTNEKNKWDYLNFFPSAHISYELKNENNLQISYSRRINRPRFRYLLPFQTFSDQRNLWMGNPELQPEYINSYELGYLKYFKKGSLFSSIYHRHRTGVINRVTTVNEDGLTERLPINISTENNYGFEFNGSYKFSKKISLNSSVNLFRAISKGSYQGINLDNDIYTWSTRSMIKMKLIKKVDFQTSFNYRAPQETGQGSRKAMYSLDLSASKDILNGKGTLVASVRDLLNTRKRRSITETENLYTESEFQWRSRQFLLSFTYRINQKKKRGSRNKSFDESEEF